MDECHFVMSLNCYFKVALEMWESWLDVLYQVNTPGGNKVPPIWNVGWNDGIPGVCAAVLRALYWVTFSQTGCHTTRTATLDWSCSAALLLMYSVRLLCFWRCESSMHTPPPSPPHLLPFSWNPNLSLQINQMGACWVPPGVFFLQWNYAMTGRNNWGKRPEWCFIEHHYHNLERPSPAQTWESLWPLSHKWAESAPYVSHF